MNIKLCPRCGQSNACMAQTDRPQDCWCMQLTLSATLKDQLPESSQCYCERCLRQLQQQADAQPQIYQPVQP
ncbi:cysteine-rich CWC family protein [Rheinheimera sp.]|uniref:cysteine-rich CWC family protein n=1 Tax=Rheinheimera sp. TaxID=1869214 RepID=UPI00307CD11C